MNKKFIVYLETGLGVPEAPSAEGETLGVFEGTEEEVKAWCERKNKELHPKPTGWDSPMCRYKVAKQLK